MLPTRTSELVALRRQIDAELHKRFAEVFTGHRALAFAQRQDELFNEHWTPEAAAADYRFERYETDGDQYTLVGITAVGCFTYRISISFPAALADTPDAIDAYLRGQYDLCRSKAKPQAATRD